MQDYGSSIYQGNIMNQTGNRFKKMVYAYDLISGKVNQVSYQPNAVDQFYHRYGYDDENRITKVFTSSDSLVWDLDAAYDYYRHGPLARTVLGQNSVQGLDYAYTIEGWLKGVNSSSVGDGTYDMGGDGKAGGVNSIVARDAFSFGLHYYQNDAAAIVDYKPIGGTSYKPFPNPTQLVVGSNSWNLFNGNIATMVVNVPKLGTAMQYKFKYDQLNRLTQTYTYTGLTTTNSWNVSATDDYREQVSYDPNGNIRTYWRNGTIVGGGQQLMDKMTYQYEKNSAGLVTSNKLRYVHDQVPSVNYADDIDSQTSLTLALVNAEKSASLSTDNYQYDAIGNLVKDNQAGINSITWNVYGKISTISKPGVFLVYTYDASGNRISKTNGGKITYYVRDASGNIMSIYTKDPAANSGDLAQTETDLYGSARLGMNTLAVNVEHPVTPTGEYLQQRGWKFYEGTDHRGNVLVTFDDRVLQHSTNNSTVDYSNADVITATDYYPFGMQEPGRKFALNNSYRFGFNGKELDTDPVQYDYGFRIYDPRLARFKSVDPLFKSYPWNSSYSFAEDEPISNIDLDGLEKYKITIRTFLPYTYVWEPQANNIIDKANKRWYPQYKNVETHGGFKTEQQFEVDFYSVKAKYSPTPMPSTLQKDLSTGEINKYENSGLGDFPTVAYMNNKSASILATISTKNPATPWYLPTPAIDYTVALSISKDGKWTLKGNWDGFPALEIFIENTETGKVDLIEFNKPSDAGKDLKDRSNPKEITNLFPVFGDVKINRSGKLGDNPQQDKQTPSPKVAENNQRFSNQNCNCGPEPGVYVNPGNTPTANDPSVGGIP